MEEHVEPAQMLANGQKTFDDDFENADHSPQQRDSDVSQQHSPHPRTSKASQNIKGKTEVLNESILKNAEREKENSSNNEKKTSQNRIASGNRMRPGERLYSAKSGNNPNSSPGADDGQQLSNSKICWTFEPVNLGSTVPAAQNEVILGVTSKSTQIKLLNVVQTEEEPDKYISEEISSSVKWVKIKLDHNFHYLRVILVKKRDEKFSGDFYFCHGKNALRLGLSAVYETLAAGSEDFLDIGFIVCTNTVELFQTIVPMNEEPNPIDGLSEMGSLIHFLKNSKFSVSKFFGFELDAEGQEFVVSAEAARETLANYELSKTDFLLNCIKTDSKGSCSLKRLMDVFPKWCALIEKTDVFIALQEQPEEETEEPFDGDFEMEDEVV